MSSSLIGQTLGKYRILEKIGRGGMGVVYKAHDTVLDRLVAIKVLAPHLTCDQEFVKRFLREARSAARLEHPHIVTIHDVAQAQGYHFIPWGRPRTCMLWGWWPTRCWAGSCLCD